MHPVKTFHVRPALPVLTLGSIAQERLQELAQDDAFLAHLDSRIRSSCCLWSRRSAIRSARSAWPAPTLGVGAVLFAGLAIGALDASLRLPEIVYLLGLVLFVYTVGLANGASFVATLVRGRGLRINALVVAVLIVMAGLTLVAQRVLHLSPPMAAGMFAATLTNTPTLAAELEFVRRAVAGSAEPVVG
jgi:AspT/YidE/YbjL antiporter-like protein